MVPTPTRFLAKFGSQFGLIVSLSTFTSLGAFASAAQLPESDPVGRSATSQAGSHNAARSERVHAWIGAWMRSVSQAAELSSQQANSLHQHLVEAANADQARWMRLKQESTTPDTTVHWFMGYMGPVWNLTRAFEYQAERLLDTKQWGAYTTWRDRHHERIAGFFARRAVAVMHVDLFLTPPQRAICESAAVDWNRDHPNGVFLLRRPIQIASAKPLRQLVAQLPNDLLTFNQRLRLDYIRDAKLQVKFDRRTSSSTANRRIRDLDQKFAEDGLNTVVVRVDYLTTVLSLSVAQQRRLALAGKGAVRRLRQSWREAAQNTTARIELPESEDVVVSLLFPEQFATDDLWTNTLKDLDVDSRAARDTDTVAHRGAVGLVMGILDQELVLDEIQIEPLQRLVQQTEPERVSSHASNMPEIAMVARTLIRIDHEAIAAILSESQRECWRQIQNVFSFDGLDSASIRWMTQSPDLRLTESAS